jgi:hypothetical protein
MVAVGIGCQMTPFCFTPSGITDARYARLFQLRALVLLGHVPCHPLCDYTYEVMMFPRFLKRVNGAAMLIGFLGMQVSNRVKGLNGKFGGRNERVNG